MQLGLKDKVVLVTGASKGIGKAIAQAFAAEGARVAIAARNPAALEAAAAEMHKATSADVLAVVTDVTRAEDVEQMAGEVIARFGTVHVLVNNAGGAGKFSSFDQLSDQDWLDVFELNVMSAVRATRAVLPHMQRQKWGRIINISSESGTQPDAFMPQYNASKSALNSLTKSLSKAYAKDGILVNTVSPAFIMTPLVQQFMEQRAQAAGTSPAQAEADFLAQNRPHIELKRPGRSEEVASAVVFLASEEASFITGTNLRVDGGSVASI